MNWFLQIYDLNNLLLCNSSHISGFCKVVQKSNLLPTSIHVWRRISCTYGKTCHHRAQRCQFNTLTQRQRTFIKEGYFFLENIKERGIVAVKHSLTTRTVPWMLFQEGPQKHCPYNQPGAGHMLLWSYQGQLATWLEIRTRCGIERYSPFICPFKMHFFLFNFMGYNWQLKKYIYLDFLGGTVDENPHANAEDVAGSIPDLGRFHMLQSNWACWPQLLSPRGAATEAGVPRACALQQEKPPPWEVQEPNAE